MGRDLIFKEIDEERARQDGQWGGKGYDDKHDVRDWVAYVLNFLARTVAKEANWGFNLKRAREAFVKVAALAIAAIESIDRKIK